MVASKESFSSLQSFDGPSIQMGNNSKVQAKGKGSINLEHEKFKYVLYVPSLGANILFVYQMTHIGSPKRVIIRGNLGSKMGLIRKRANNKFCELEFKNK